MNILIGVVSGALFTALVFSSQLAINKSTLETICKGESYVIEEPLIKKTITCSVEVNK